MSKPVQAAMTVGCTVVLLLLLLTIRPFAMMSDGLDALFGVPPKWTQVDEVYKNRNTQEVTHGDDPVPSLQVLAGFWGARPEARLVLFCVNSPMPTVLPTKG